MRTIQARQIPAVPNCNADRQNGDVPESEDTWDDSHEDNEYFIYILKLDDGKFYARTHPELRERMGEHRDGKRALPTEPSIVWFEM